MKIAIACDHGGYLLKQVILIWLEENDIDYEDFGCYSTESVDYPVFAERAARAVAAGECDKGIVICTTGIGVSIAANKVKGIRAGLAYNTVMARLSREHNDANVLSLGGRMQSLEDALAMAKVFLETPFSEDPRHVRRIQELAAYEDAHRA